MEVLLAKERILKLIQAWDEKQIESWSFPALLLQLLNDSRTINEMLKQREQAANPAVQKKHEEQAAQSFTSNWNFSMINNDEEYSIQYKENLENSSNAITTVLPTEEPEYSLSMGYEHLSTILEMKSNEVIKSSVEKLIPIPSECEVTSDNDSECDVPVCEDSSTFDVLKDHFEILFDSNNDDITSDDDAFEDIEYVEASLLDSELVSLEEKNDVYQEEKDIDLEDILQIQDIILYPYSILLAIIRKRREVGRLTSVVKKDISDNSTNDSLLEKVYLFLASDNSILPGIENIDYDSEGNIHFLEELLVDDFIPLPKNESSNFDHHDDPSFPRPPPEPPNVEFFFDFEPNSREVILVVKNNIDELNEDECFDPGGEIDVFANIENADYFPFIYLSFEFFYRISLILRFLLYFSPLGVKTPFLTLASPLRASGISLGWNFYVL
nr:hypothetical protein [Tanacetum cinerariifolium]